MSMSSRPPITSLYKEYVGRAVWSDEHQVYHGELLAQKDVITYRARTEEEVHVEFRISVDDYLAFCAARGEQPEVPALRGYLPQASAPTNLFQLGDFTLNSGAKSKWKIECDALTDDDWAALAVMSLNVVGMVSSVEGVPRGGLMLAQAISSLLPRNPPPGAPHLIVDDVLTTGGSLARTREEYEGRHPHHDGPLPVKGLVVFARGPCPAWVTPLLQLPPALWLKKG